MEKDALVSLAILKVNFDTNQNYLDNFVPFLVEAMRHNSEPIVNLETVRDDTLSQFGISIPLHVIKTLLLQRLKKQGYVFADTDGLRKNFTQLNKSDFTDIRDKVLERHEAILLNMQQFAKEKLNLDATIENLEHALIDFVQRDPTPIVKATLSSSALSFRNAPRIGDKFIIARYIENLQKTSDPRFRYIADLAKGYMLSMAIFTPNYGDIHASFSNTAVYFDTRFVIQALGFAGANFQEPATELLEILKETSAKLHVFEHTRDEIFGILDACKTRLLGSDLKRAFGDTLEFFIQEKMSASDIAVRIGNLDSLIEELGIASSLLCLTV